MELKLSARSGSSEPHGLNVHPQRLTDTVNAASVSLTMNENSPKLHQIEEAEEQVRQQGPDALQDIVAIDAQQVDRAEGQLGAAFWTVVPRARGRAQERFWD